MMEQGFEKHFMIYIYIQYSTYCEIFTSYRVFTHHQSFVDLNAPENRLNMV